jgi:hypothetical protein
MSDTATVTTRKASNDDIYNLVAFKKYYWLTVYSHEKFARKADIERSFNEPAERAKLEVAMNYIGNQIFFIAEIDGRLSGYTQLSKTDSENVIESFYVIQNVLKAEVEEALLVPVFNWFNSKLSIKAKVVSYDTQQRILYQKLGFSVVVDTDNYEKNNNLISLPLICMRKKVG